MIIAIVAKAEAIIATALSRAAAGSMLGIRYLFVALRRRRELRRLLESEDHALADIGIDRDDLRAALSEPLRRDPTAALARRVKAPGGRGGDTLPDASSRERSKQCRRSSTNNHRDAIPTCAAVPPSMDLERYLAVLDRKSHAPTITQSGMAIRRKVIAL